MIFRLLSSLLLAAAPEAPLPPDLARFEDASAAEIRTAVQTQPELALAAAESLWRRAEKNQLSADGAELAGELLGHDDRFVRGLAEWALALKVGAENNGQLARWPQADPPAWYDRWTNLPPAAWVEADWVRQAVAHKLYRDAAKLAGSADAMLRRAEQAVEEYRRWGAERFDQAAVSESLAQLRAVREQLRECVAAAPADLDASRRLWLDARRAQRTIALANPAADVQRLVFLKQFVPHTVRNITRSYAWKHKPGGDICVLEDLQAGGPARPVLQGRLGPGYVWGLDLWWEADRVVFSYARQPNWPPAVDTAHYAVEGTNVFRLRQQHEPLHLFEAPLDGSPIRQLTDDPYWSDFEPTYCANGDIIFASDRCGRAAQCGNVTYDHTNPNLYLLSADRQTLRRWTDSKDIDRYPHSLDDGRIAYTHWEYQERHFMEVHALWTARPDGTLSDALFKQHLRAPCGLRDTRSVPGSARLVSIATGHHTFAYGPVVLVNPAGGLNRVAGLEIVTPGVRPQEGPMAGHPVADGGVLDAGGLYQTPWALSDKCFLVSYAYARPNCTAPAGADSNGFALYLIDTFGNRELIHRDPLLSCTFPIPLRPRPRPPILPETPPASQPQATCYVADVYDGMDEVPRGTIKYLRIAQHVPWPFDAERGQVDYISGVAGAKHLDFTNWNPVRVLGTVPVAADGSASFQVPADTAIYFQALDERQMEVRRMRSFVSLAAGEVRGCTGCHESRGQSPLAARSLPEALRREPALPLPPPWGAETLLGYEWLVQPILDRHCVRCHGLQAPQGGLDLTATRAQDGLLQSYRTLFGRLPGRTEPGRILVSCSDRFSNADVTRPWQFGSHNSPLIRVLLDDPLHGEEVHLESQEWLALVTWVDANAPYHDRFMNKRPAGGGPPRRDVQPVFPTPLAISTGFVPLPPNAQ